MPESFEALLIVIYFILPGFIAFKTKNLFVVGEPEHATDKLLNYILFGCWNTLLLASLIKKVVEEDIPVFWGSLLIVLLSPILHGILLACFEKFDWIRGIAKKAKIFRKMQLIVSTRGGVLWNVIFDTPKQQWVRVITTSGIVYEGKAKVLSGEGKGDMFLTDVAISDLEGKQIKAEKDIHTTCKGMYINMDNVEAIEVYK